MPICLNCEIELPGGTIDCPHCGDECEQEVESEAGGILAGAWGDDDEGDEGDQLSFSEADDEPAEELPLDDEPAELPQVDLGNEMDELPMASAEPVSDEEIAEEKARKKAERKAKREAAAAAANGDDGNGDGDDGGGKKKRKSTTSKRERPAAGAKGAKSGKRAKKGEPRPATPKKDPTLSQNRKAVLMALFSWFVFVGLYSGAFTKGLLFPSANPGAAQANMANVMFAGLGLFAMLFLWAHLKMGRYISVTTVVIALGVEGFFIYRGLENMTGFIGVGLFTVAQLLLLTGSGWLIRSFFGFVFTVVGGALFCLPHVVDVYLRPPEAQAVRVRKLMSGELGLDGVSTEEGGTRAKTEEVWEEMIKVADEFDAAETAVKDLAGMLGLGFMEGQITKPKLRERIVAEVVISQLYMVNGGYTSGAEGERVDPQKGVDGLLDSLDFEQQTKELTEKWRGIRDRAVDRMMLYMRRFMEAPPLGSGTVGEPGKYYSVEVKLFLAGWSEAKTWPIVVQKDDSRFAVVDNAWRAKTETLGETKAKRVWLQADWWNLTQQLAKDLEWDDSEMSHVVAAARKLAAMDAEIIVTEVEAPEGAEVPADEGGAGDEGAGEEGAGDEGDGKEGDEEGDDEDGDEGDDEGSGDEGGDEEPGDGDEEEDE